MNRTRDVEEEWRRFFLGGEEPLVRRCEPWLPLGIGIHTGVAYIGSVGSGDSSAARSISRASRRRWR